MTNTIQFKAVLALMICLAATAAVAQGDAAYKAKCAMCHGAAGIPNAAMAAALGVRAPTDPALKAMSEAAMITVVKNGKGKMQPVTGLSDAQVKEAVDTFRSFSK